MGLRDEILYSADYVEGFRDGSKESVRARASGRTGSHGGSIGRRSP